MTLVDSHGRKINYLRISITDHCNLSCHYCSPPFSGRHHVERSEILTFEELTRVAEAAVSVGITKIRLTGGEPLVRRGVEDFCKMLSGIGGLEDLALTTNGVRLGGLAEPLRRAGVRRVNVSLDTLKPDRFESITGRDALERVKQGIAAAHAVGLDPIKINTVVMRNVNHDEIAALASLSVSKPYEVRFIELMPFKGGDKTQYEQQYMPVAEIMKHIPGLHNACIGNSRNSSGPARICKLPNAAGKVGFIAPLSWHICRSCNRLRLTADGKIRTCLFAGEEFDIKSPLRQGAGREVLAGILRHAASRKPNRHRVAGQNRFRPHERSMYAIGG